MTPETVGGEPEHMIHHRVFDPSETENKCLGGLKKAFFTPDPSTIEAAAGIVLGIPSGMNLGGVRKNGLSGVLKFPD